MQIIFTLKYDSADVSECCRRLNLSLRSLYVGSASSFDKFQILIFNFSETCIEKYIFLKNDNLFHYHLPSSGNFSRAKFLNHIARYYVTTPFFYISDIDLIFPVKFLDNLQFEIQRIDKFNISRVVFLNGNMESATFPFVPTYRRLKDFLYQMPQIETAQTNLLKRVKHKVDFAHGCGIFNHAVFLKLRGFNEEFVGYGPEDGLFNARLKKRHLIEYNEDEAFATMHLWHKKFARYQVGKNMRFYKQEMAKLNSLSVDANFQGGGPIVANLKNNWGKL
jgi:predicted glycosyltransferase involved in capsule biosynthesis